MCGIAGWVDPGGRVDDPGWVVRRMTDTLAARGPDSAGLWTGPQAALGHRRLAVMDPAPGRQPMLISDDQDRAVLVLTYSGEVFNHAELRAELELLGHKFATTTDTEVALHAFREWGTGAAERLNGSYALAVWDPERRRLLLVRDRLGVEPLFYAHHGTGVLFASEPKALFAGGLIAPVVDDTGLRDFLASARTPGGSLFRGVKEVRPGTTVIVDEGGVREHRYWVLPAQPHTDDLDATIERTHELLEDITRRQVQPGVPLAALLSGGLDSSVLAALGQRARRGGLHTFTVAFTGGFASDQLRATEDERSVHDLVERCGLDHRDLVLGPAELTDPAHRQAVVTAKDAPSTGDTDTSLYLLFRAVRKHAAVALSGEGADEVFGGYPWFHRADTLTTAGYPWRYLAGRSGTYLALLRDDVAAELDITAHRENHYRQALTEVPALPGETRTQRRMRAVFYLHLTRWLPDLLDRKDRLSMAAGLEVRVPFCDHRLVEYAFNTPWSQHISDGREKSVLRSATARHLPASVTTRAKAPYPSTQAPAYDHAIRTQARDLLATPAAPAWTYLDQRHLRERVDRPVTDRATRAGIDFALSLDVWLRGLAQAHRP